MLFFIYIIAVFYFALYLLLGYFIPESVWAQGSSNSGGL